MKFSRLSILILFLFAYPILSSGQNAVTIANNEKISDAEKEMLIRGYSEEKLARDVYTYLDDIYDMAVFFNIKQAEQRHVGVMKDLLNTYKVEVPSGYGPYEKEFIDLKAKGKKSKKDALEVGLMIEILDIEDLDKTIASIENELISNAYSNLRKASVNHLNAFARNMELNEFTTDIDWQKYSTASVSNGNKMGKQKMKGKSKGNMSQKKTQKNDCRRTCPKASTCKKS